MSRSGGGPEGFGLLSLAFPSNIMTLQNTTNNTTEKKKQAGGFFTRNWGWDYFIC